MIAPWRLPRGHQAGTQTSIRPLFAGEALVGKGDLAEGSRNWKSRATKNPTPTEPVGICCVPTGRLGARKMPNARSSNRQTAPQRSAKLTQFDRKNFERSIRTLAAKDVDGY